MLGRGLYIAGACALALGSFTPNAWAQDDESVERPKYAPLKLDLGEGRYLRFITWHQVWTRFTELNPGSTVNGTDQENYFDIGLRRARFLAFAQLNEFQIMTHFGINNQSFLDGNNFETPGADRLGRQRKPRLFMHDVWTQYSLFKNYVSFGAGLHYWHGISRMTNASTLNFLAVDAPITNWPTIELSDQFARYLGVWLKGQISGFDYRISLNKPFTPIAGTTPGPDIAAYNDQNNTVSVGGYFEYQFLDGESNTLPYKVGTYIGSKKVFNLGAGFYYHPSSMVSLDDMGEREFHDQVLIGVDLFADMPIGERETGGAFSAYLVFYNYDFGPNHIRNIGIMNIGGGGSSLNGGGNAYPSIGTGQHVYFQGGYLIPPSLVNNWDFMPYFAFQYSNLEARDDPMLLGEIGLNWFLEGHHAKITLAYRNRPIYTLNDAMESVADDRAGEFIVQTMIFL